MEKKIAIKVENIANPPEKMRLMYEAVSAMIRERKEISTFKVSEITARAGIGKGTAYEYFSSKEELIAHALLYEYSAKIQNLAELAFVPKTFRDRCYRVMDWIMENKEYNQMFTQLFKLNVSGSETECGVTEIADQVRSYIYHLIDKFMEEAWQEGAIKETDAGKRSLALLTAMVQYAFVLMGFSDWRYDTLGDEELRDFIYESMVRALN